MFIINDDSASFVHQSLGTRDMKVGIVKLVNGLKLHQCLSGERRSEVVCCNVVEMIQRMGSNRKALVKELPRFTFLVRLNRVKDILRILVEVQAKTSTAHTTMTSH